MTTSQIEQAAGRLAKEYKTLRGALSNNRDDISVESAPDPLDQVQLMGERDLAIRTLDRNSTMLRQIRRSMVRIADGTYGLCAHCEEDISLKRLNALPWALLCIQCQEQKDGHELEVEDVFEPAEAE